MNNKYILQGYTLTTAGDDYGLFAQRGILAVVEVAQAELTGHKLKGIASNALISKDQKGDLLIDIRVTDIMAAASYENYKLAKKGLEELFSKKMIWRQDNMIHYRHFVEKIDFDTREGWARLTISDEVWRMILDYSRGYRKFELEKAMKMRGVYSLRLYELVAGKTEPQSFTLKALREMFGIDKKKYKLTKDFISRVIDAAKAELDKVAPYTFTYKPIYEDAKQHTGKGRLKITGITFYPKRQPRNEDKTLTDKQLLARNYTAVIDAEVKAYLRQNYGFEESEIQRNIDTILKAQAICDLPVLFSKIYRRATEEADNCKGYVIAAMKEEIRQYELENGSIEP